MKSVGKYIVAFIGAIIMSCSNFTDIQPTHALTPNNAFKTMNDLELHLNGIYSGFQSTGYHALAYGTLPDMMSDNLQIARKENASRDVMRVKMRLL